MKLHGIAIMAAMGLSFLLGSGLAALLAAVAMLAMEPGARGVTAAHWALIYPCAQVLVLLVWFLIVALVTLREDDWRGEPDA